jgi:hypothetical protein
MQVHKALTSVYDYYKDLPDWAKGVVVVGVGLIAYFTGKAVVNGLNNEAKRQKAQKDIQAVKGDLDKLRKNGITQSFADSQYSGWATALVKQYDGCDPTLLGIPTGTGILGIPKNIQGSNSYKATYAVFNQFKNDADFLKLVGAFALRTYDQCGIWNGNVENVTLYGAISDELNHTEIGYLNDLLKSKKINYTV